MQAIIPLAGKGTRLRPLTHTRPKPLVEVANRPVLDHVLDRLIEAGVDEVVCITGYLREQIRDHLETEYAGLEKHYVQQEEQLGTAHAIRLAEPFVDGPVLVIFVDTIFEADLSVLDERPDDDGVIWVKEVEDYQRFGVVVTDDDGYMTRIVEKPDEPVSRLASDPMLGEYFLTDAFQHMIDEGARISTAEVDGWWDCGKFGTLLSTNRELLERGLAREPEGEAVRARGPVLVDPTATLEDVELGPNVAVAGGAEVFGCRLQDCIVGGHARLEDCRLERSVVGAHAVLRRVRGVARGSDPTEGVGARASGEGTA